MNGGKASCSASLDAGADVPAWSLSARLDDAQANYEITPLLQYVLPFLALEGERALFSGKLEGAIDLEGPRSRPGGHREGHRGKGSVRVRDGGHRGEPVLLRDRRCPRSDLGEVLFSEMGSDSPSFPGRSNVTKAYFTGKPGGKLRNLGLVGTTRFDGSDRVRPRWRRRHRAEHRLEENPESSRRGSRRWRGADRFPEGHGDPEVPETHASAPDAGGILDRVLGGEGKEEGDPAAMREGRGGRVRPLPEEGPQEGAKETRRVTCRGISPPSSRSSGSSSLSGSSTL